MSAMLSTTEGPQTRSRFAVNKKPADSNPPLILDAPKPRSFVPMWHFVYSASKNEAANITRAMRARRREGKQLQTAIAQVKRALKARTEAREHLEQLKATLPANMQIDWPAVQVGFVDGRANFVREKSQIDDVYKDWIRTERSQGAPKNRIAFLERQRIEKINLLADITDAQIVEQTESGYLQARITYEATQRVLHRSIREVCQTRPQSIADCKALLSFLAWHCAAYSKDMPSINENLVQSLARRVIRGIDQFQSKKGAR